MNRVTPSSQRQQVTASLQANLARLQATQDQISSGRRLGKPSDSPTDTATAMSLRSDHQRGEQLDRAIDDGSARLSTADQALMQTNTLLLRVRQLAVAGSNDTNTAAERSAMAAEVDQLRASLLDVANTRYLGQPVFAGTQDTENAYDPSGAYLGNTTALERRVTTGPDRVAVSITGPDTFGTLFADPAAAGGLGVLARVSDALRTGDRTKLDQAIKDIDAASDTVRTSQSIVGARASRLESVKTLGAAATTRMETQLATVEGIDLAKALTDLSIQQTAYQAALSATAKVIQPSILDFLR
ncbi:flagellar hook-associated protein 3 [Phycicoccus sp. HDW14]|uniref:flagellar hook-associated protein FlgL n=1 Tax=Phycicoccus sp. HDW14 TaxID=2714941 RepID=UPI001408523E|nr:flagellar hook-associated protein FlgL [Phycicoccus sp. HDW14]QIM21934.1 flagellar hook-associated protein 3 [Phycicoccus sp. HDW14]